MTDKHKQRAEPTVASVEKAAALIKKWGAKPETAIWLLPHLALALSEAVAEAERRAEAEYARAELEAEVARTRHATAEEAFRQGCLLAARSVAEERERCAKVAESHTPNGSHFCSTDENCIFVIADKIREGK